MLDATSTSTLGASDRAQSWNGESASRSEGTDATSTSHSLSLLALDPRCPSSEEEDQEQQSSKQYDLGLEELDSQSKEAVLHEMFPSVKAFRISYTLKKSGHNFGRAVEALLNQVFLEEEKVANGEDANFAKGIDGFMEDGTRGRQGRGKRKKKSKGERRASSTPVQSIGDGIDEGVSTWEAARRDVEFVCQRTGLPMQMVSSQYHKSGASLANTILAILDTSDYELAFGASEDLVIQKHASELGEEFPTIAMPHLVTIVRLTHPSTASAHELAKVLAAKSMLGRPTGGIEIIPTYSPIDLTSTDLPAPTKRSTAQNLYLDITTATALTAANSLARQAAFNKASAAYRKSKSDPFMGAAAGYYSSLGRDHDASARKYSAAAADALVNSQSSKDELDLHGVGVKDAVRIARERVTDWWVGMGDARLTGALRKEFRIVTGMGNHSEGGRGKLGPAVGKMLVREGWRVEIGQGVLVVTGVARKR